MESFYRQFLTWFLQFAIVSVVLLASVRLLAWSLSARRGSPASPDAPPTDGAA